MHIDYPWSHRINKTPYKTKLAHLRMVLTGLLTYVFDSS